MCKKFKHVRLSLTYKIVSHMNKTNLLLVIVFAFFTMAWTCNDLKWERSDDDTPTAQNPVEDKNEKEDEEDDKEDGENELVQSFPDEHFTKFENFDASLFDENSHIIDNEWMPMLAGTHQIYEGMDLGDEGERIKHSLISIVTDLTKVIDGVNCAVIFERDYKEGGILEEAELAFFAQDKEGNVWHTGEYVEHYDDDFFSGGRLCIVGPVEGAKAGIFMPKDPKVDNRSYSMGFAPAPFNWSDRFFIHEMGTKVSNASGDYTNVLAV